jgi:ribosomal protein S18 acetylase RimI-like enzyme
MGVRMEHDGPITRVILDRAPYRRTHADALVAFAGANPPSPLLALPARRILVSLAPPEGVFDLARDGRRCFVAAVVDRCDNLHDAALLEVLGWDRDVPLDTLLAEVTPDALEVGRAAGRALLSLSLPAGVGGDLAAAGWAVAEGSYILERDRSPWDTPPLPPGARWEDLDRRGVAEHYAVLRAAFADDPAMMVPDLATFSAVSLGAPLPVRVLRRDGCELAFSRVTVEDGRVGYVASIGRAPEWRGRGLGCVALAEALRQLATQPVGRFRLGVTATNTAAVALYLRAGFRVLETWQTWRRPLESA